MPRRAPERLWYTGPQLAWALSGGVILQPDEEVTRAGRSRWYNGEHWTPVRRADGTTTTVPDTLLEDEAGHALPRCTACGRACSRPEGVHTGCEGR